MSAIGYTKVFFLCKYLVKCDTNLKKSSLQKKSLARNLQEVPRCGGDCITSTMALRVVVGEEKGTQFMGLRLGHVVPWGDKTEGTWPSRLVESRL
jgi:hypothetical protein